MGDTATKNKTIRLQDWHVLLQAKLREKERSTLEGRVDERIRESLGRVRHRLELPEKNGMVIARCLCEVLGLSLSEETYLSFFSKSDALDEAIATFVSCRQLLRAGILVDPFAQDREVG